MKNRILIGVALLTTTLVGCNKGPNPDEILGIEITREPDKVNYYLKFG
mgnify:CR=1 FL=1